MAKKSKSKPDIIDQDHVDNYNRVVACAELNSIQLLNVNFDVTPRYFDEDEAENKIGYKIKTLDSHYDKPVNFAACLVEFNVESKKGDNVTLKCRAQYAVSYHLKEDCEETAVKTFLKRVGVFACYPYFRGVFANLDWSANTRLPPLPIHRENLATRPGQEPPKSLSGKKKEVSTE